MRLILAAGLAMVVVLGLSYATFLGLNTNTDTNTESVTVATTLDNQQIDTGSQPVASPSSTGTSSEFTSDGFPVQGSVIGYYQTIDRDGGYEGGEQTCDVFVVTGGDERFLSRYKREIYMVGSDLALNLLISSLDPDTRNAVLSSSEGATIKLVITDFEEPAHGAGPCYSTLDQVRVLN